MTIIDTTAVAENEKFMCIYNKLAASPKFKDLFIDTFGESDSLNVTFKTVPSITGANATTSALPGSTNTIDSDGNINLSLLIKVDESYMSSSSALAVAKTILHESIHAYLILKHIKCNAGTPIDDIIDNLNNKTLEELLNYYYETACPSEEQHEFMFEYMIPTMSERLSDIKDALVPPSHQENAESTMFIDETNPIVDALGNYINNVPWNWNQFYEYLSMAGLHQTNGFLNNIQNTPPKLENYNSYITIGVGSFRKECTD